MPFDTAAGDEQPGGLTILTCDARHTASKLYRATGDTYIKVRDYDMGFLFRAEARAVSDLADLAALITDIRSKRNVVILRGALDDAFFERIARDPNYRITRRMNARNDEFAAHLRDTARQWLMIDLDGVPLPPDAEINQDGAKLVGQIITDILPSCFAGVTCFFQWSSSAGLVPGIAKLHLWFWLDRPWLNADLRRWFRLHCPHVDHAPYNAVQPHFVCDPIIEGGSDPILDRLGWVTGESEIVAMPALPPPEDAKVQRKLRQRSDTGHAATDGLHAESIEEALAHLGDGDGLRGFHAPLLAATMQYALRCAKGALRDDMGAKTTLIEAINEAPKREGREVSAYLSDVYLSRIIEGGFALIANTLHGLPRVNWPMGFGMTQIGLWYTDPDDPNSEPKWIAQVFDIIGSCDDGTGGSWGSVLQWRDRQDHHHVWIIGDEMLHGKPEEIAKHLARNGMQVSFAGHFAMRRCLASLAPTKHIRAVLAAGWHGNSFVLRDGTVIGSEPVMLRPELVMQDASCEMAGTLADWQDHVAKYAEGNSRIALFLCAAFAGALLEPASEPSGGFHEHGVSQSGKSTSGYAAGSVHGKGSRRRGGNVHQWAATSNGLESVAARYCDNCLILDEISQADAKDAGDAIYRLANESGKIRANQMGGFRPRADWRILFLSTGEVTLSQRMSDAGKRTMTGMAIRLIDIPADAGAGMGVFENLHGFDHPAKLADHIRAAAQTYYGVAGRQFIEQVARWRQDDADGMIRWLHSMREAFIAKVPDGADGQVRSVAGRFGIVAAAGEMAINWGILNWTEGEAIRACERCFTDWLGARGTIGSGEKHDAIRRVRATLEAHGTSRFLEIQRGYEGQFQNMASRFAETKKPDPEEEVGTLGMYAKAMNMLGYCKREKDKHGKDIRMWYLITPEMWASEVCKGMDPKLVARALDERGWLDREHEHYTKKVRVPNSEKQQRFYVVNGDILAADDEE